MLKFLIIILKYFLILLIPFLALIRGAVYVHSKYDPGPLISVGAGILFAFIVLMMYITVVYYLFTDRVGGMSAFKLRAFFTMFLIVAYCAYGLFFISEDNLKHSSLSGEMRKVHPIIRLAMSTWSVVDPSLIITDVNRRPEDYRKMGLPSKARSLHYKQKDGYAYAMDLRTRGHSEIRNSILRNYCRVMGLRTLRHGGTADHLHISLYCHELPGAK